MIDNTINIQEENHVEDKTHQTEGEDYVCYLSERSTLSNTEHGNFEEMLDNCGTNNSEMVQFDPRKPKPESLGYYLPKDVMAMLVDNTDRKNSFLQPIIPKKLKRSRKHDNVWNYPGQRDKLKHLIKAPPCICGAGRDISFLYENSRKEKKMPKVPPTDSSKVRQASVEKLNQKINFSDSLLPSEYHIVKSKGVLGLEYMKSEYSVNPEDHEKHLTVFPSMVPGSRFEVLQLRRTMKEMMDKQGITNASDLVLDGPTQIHNMIALIKKEQDIYNLIFHEIIRQTTVECADRGALLADLRKKYSDLLSRVPEQIQSLYEEVLAQRALDRRLTDELSHFKATVNSLTGELSSVKQHDAEITKEARSAQEELREALHESRRNAALLTEYHELYELQRKRLERQIAFLMEERDVWSQVAYSVTIKVTNEHKLNTARRLHLAEKSWQTIAFHLTIMLTDEDTKDLVGLTKHLGTWRNMSEDCHVALRIMEETLRNSLTEVWGSIHRFYSRFQTEFLNSKMQVEHMPSQESEKEILGLLRDWENRIQVLAEIFGSNEIVEVSEKMKAMTFEWGKVTQLTERICGRHILENGDSYPELTSHYVLSDKIESYLCQLFNRVTGENGIATGVINLSSAIEQWRQRLVTTLRRPVKETEWFKFYNDLKDWTESIDVLVNLIGDTQSEKSRKNEEPHLQIDALVLHRDVQKWLSAATNGITSEDAKLTSQVEQYHKEAIKWVVQILLHLAEANDNSKEANEGAMLGQASVGELLASEGTLSWQLHCFTDYLTKCVESTIKERCEEKRQADIDDSEEDMRQFRQLRFECDEWKHCACLLLKELTGKEIHSSFEVPIKELGDSADSKNNSGIPVFEFTDEYRLAQLGEAALELQPNDVIETKKLEQSNNVAEETSDVMRVKGIAADENAKDKVIMNIPKSDAVDGEDRSEDLAAIRMLQKQLILTEERAQEMEGKNDQLEVQKEAYKEKVMLLEKKIREQSAEIDLLKVAEGTTNVDSVPTLKIPEKTVQKE